MLSNRQNVRIGSGESGESGEFGRVWSRVGVHAKVSSLIRNE